MNAVAFAIMFAALAYASEKSVDGFTTSLMIICLIGFIIAIFTG